MNKHKKQKVSRPNLSPLTMLRPRLDGLFGNEDLSTRDNIWIKGDLEAVFKGVSADQFLPVLVKAYQAAPVTIQARLDEVLPEWLVEQEYIAPLSQLIQQQKIDEADLVLVSKWLKASGIDHIEFQKPAVMTSFYKGFLYADEFQGVLLIAFYVDARRYKIQVLSFLLDFQPPWEGSIKDSYHSSTGIPDKIIADVVGYWREQDIKLKELTAEESKIELLERLDTNRREGIRLPRDLIADRQLFWKYFPCLPDIPKMDTFTPEDFDYLAKNGEIPEKLIQIEQTQGYRTRLPDGKEILLIR